MRVEVHSHAPPAALLRRDAGVAKAGAHLEQTPAGGGAHPLFSSRPRCRPPGPRQHARRLCFAVIFFPLVSIVADATGGLLRIVVGPAIDRGGGGLREQETMATPCAKAIGFAGTPLNLRPDSLATTRRAARCRPGRKRRVLGGEALPRFAEGT